MEISQGRMGNPVVGTQQELGHADIVEFHRIEERLQFHVGVLVAVAVAALHGEAVVVVDVQVGAPADEELDHVQVVQLCGQLEGCISQVIVLEG